MQIIVTYYSLWKNINYKKNFKIKWKKHIFWPTLEWEDIEWECTIHQSIKETLAAWRPYLLNHWRQTSQNSRTQAKKLQRFCCEHSLPFYKNWSGAPKVSHIILIYPSLERSKARKNLDIHQAQINHKYLVCPKLTQREGFLLSTSCISLFHVLST